MKLQQYKPSRTLGILLVIVIMVVLISGLAPPSGADNNSGNVMLRWETGGMDSEIEANDISVVFNNADDASGF